MLRLKNIPIHLLYAKITLKQKIDVHKPMSHEVLKILRKPILRAMQLSVRIPVRNPLVIRIRGNTVLKLISVFKEHNLHHILYLKDSTAR